MNNSPVPILPAPAASHEHETRPICEGRPLPPLSAASRNSRRLGNSLAGTRKATPREFKKDIQRKLKIRAQQRDEMEIIRSETIFTPNQTPEEKHAAIRQHLNKRIRMRMLQRGEIPPNPTMEELRLLGLCPTAPPAFDAYPQYQFDFQQGYYQQQPNYGYDPRATGEIRSPMAEYPGLLNPMSIQHANGATQMPPQSHYEYEYEYGLLPPSPISLPSACHNAAEYKMVPAQPHSYHQLPQRYQESLVLDYSKPDFGFDRFQQQLAKMHASDTLATLTTDLFANFRAEYS